MILLLLLLGLGFAGGPLRAAEPAGRCQFKAYGPDQGLRDPAISCLAQDEQGFLWIGAENGLLRYDGVEFTKWTTADGLPASWVRRIFPIRGGGLWLATTRGLVRFQNGRVTPARFGPKETLGNPDKSLLDMDSQGRLWVLRHDGVYRQTNPTRLDPLPERPPGRSQALACDPGRDCAYVAVDQSVWEHHPDGTWSDCGPLDLPPGEAIEGLVVDGRSRLWVVGVRILRWRDPGETVFHDATADLPSAPFTESVIQRSANGQVWIPTNSGLLMVHGDARRVLGAASGLPCTWARTALVDREGSLWVVGPTLYRRLGGDSVRGFTSADGLPNDVVWVVFRDRRGRLWAGTNDGLARLDPRGWERLPGTAGLAPSSLAEDGAGNLWMAFSNGPLFILPAGEMTPTDEPYRDLLQRLPPLRARPPDKPDHPYALRLDQRGRMWIGDPGMGVFRVVLTARTPVLEPAYTEADAGVSQLVVVQIVEDEAGRIWAATNEGLLGWDGAVWRRWTTAQGLRHNYVAGIQPAGDGTLWLWYMEPLGLSRVGVTGSGLNELVHLDEEKGLASDRVYAAVRDRRGALWVGGDHGVDRLWKGQIAHIGRNAGLVGEDCCANGMWTDSGGDVWVGTSTGLARIVAGREPPVPLPPPAFVTRAVLGGRPLAPPFAGLPALDWRDASAEFAFASPSFVDEASLQFQVRLVGLEEAWRTTELRQVGYASLPGGRYRFEVRARHPGGSFGTIDGLSFDVRTAWWRSPWFVALAGLLAVGLGAAGMLWRVRAIARQRDRLESVVTQRTGELQRANAKLAEANQSLQELSLTDPLTGLHNRRYLSLILPHDVARVQRLYKDAAPDEPLPNQDLVFCMVDLDHFKRVNDTFGHAAGDVVLRQTAAVLRRAAREADIVIRWGGEEFLVVARGASREDASALAERVRAQTARQVLRLESGSEVRWTCSVGFAALPFHWRHPDWLDWDRVVAVADACLYAAKHAGRDAWVGVFAREGLSPTLHDGRLPHEMLALAEEGVVEIVVSR
jgi:diguanylate cyclase (GGDEF)-like protein